MQGQRSAIDSLPDSINFDYDSPTSNVGIDPQIFWNTFRNPPESRLSDCSIIGESSSTIPPNSVNYDDRMTQNGWPTSINGSICSDPTNLNLSSNPVVVGPASQNLDSNDVNFHSVGDDINCPISSPKRVEFENKFQMSASSSSDPFSSSSRNGGFLVEEDSGFPVNGPHLSCKRKTLEGNAGQSSSSTEQINPPHPHGQDTSQRTHRLRVNQSIQLDSVPNNSLSSTPSGGARQPDIVTARQPRRFVPMSPPLDLMSPIPSHPMFIPTVEARNSAQTPITWSASNSNVGVSRHTSSNSRTGSSAAAPHRHPSSNHSRRLSEYVRRSLLTTVGSESGGQGSNNSQLRSGPGSSQEVLPSIGGNEGNNQPRARSALWIDRQGGDGALGIPPSLRALAVGGEGRSRLVSELRNVLDMMRRGEGLRFEDVMLLDPSMLFGIADIHDQHRDMRLDVDNMSYEELLALEERIGNVNTGLSEETILNRMKHHKYIRTMSDDRIGDEPCSICQEVYNDGEGIGTLDCGHNFHSECIKQWLTQKNLCPICKTTALST